MRKIFILGMGAQKAGTTWLHSYLSGFEETNFGKKKEYHVLDFKLKPFRKMGIKRLMSLNNLRNFKQELIHQRFNDIDKDLLDNIMTASMILNPDLYFSYFNGLLVKDYRITGDFSPENAGLTAKNLKDIKLSFKKLDIDVIPFFVMRDPLERVKSNISMTIAKQKKSPTPSKEMKIISDYQKTERDKIKSDYLDTIKNILEVFGKRSYISFYERLFTKEEILKVTQLLELKYVEPKFKKFANKAKRNKANLSSEQEMLVANNYRHIYEGIYEIYGKDFVKSLWDSTKYLS